MDNLLNDGDTSNDYLDVYVKALYPELYGTVDTINTSNYGNSAIDDNHPAIRRERQCKALANFYAHEIVSKEYLRSDSDIQTSHWLTFDDANSDCAADNDYLMQVDEGTLIYHSNPSFGTSLGCASGEYFYNPDTNTVSRGSGNLTDYVVQGDIFADNYHGHYGLIYDGSNVIDANWGFDGKIHKASSASRGTDHWKITKPQ